MVRCLNYNHARPDAPVRFGPMCVKVMNDSIPAKACGEGEHAQRRRNRNAYCVDCGEQPNQQN